MFFLLINCTDVILLITIIGNIGVIIINRNVE